jgi:hypothetical protein
MGSEMETRLPVTDKEIFVVSVGGQLQKESWITHTTDINSIKVNRDEIKRTLKGAAVV